MTDLVCLDGKFLSTSQISVNPITNAAFYGRGVFTTVAVVDGNPFAWDKHWRRINDNLMSIGLGALSAEEIGLENLCGRLIAGNGHTNGRMRITVFDSSPPPLWSDTSAPKLSVMINTSESHRRPLSIDAGFSKATINSKSPIAGVKSLNYLENNLAVSEARDRGFDECLRVNERGELTSFAMGNLFWTERGSSRLITPPLDSGCLAGTTREFIVEKLDVSERTIGKAEFVQTVESLFLTSSGLGVVPVKRIDEKVLEIPDHPVMSLLPF